jgi:hypothetical protein
MVIQATVGQRGANGGQNITCDGASKQERSVVGRKSKAEFDAWYSKHGLGAFKLCIMILPQYASTQGNIRFEITYGSYSHLRNVFALLQSIGSTTT